MFNIKDAAVQGSKVRFEEPRTIPEVKNKRKRKIRRWCVKSQP